MIVNGSLICCATACSVRASFPLSPFAISAIWCAIAKPWCDSAHKPSTACKRCWRPPTSSSPRWPPMCWARADATCSMRRLRAKLPALREALSGRVEATHRLLLRQLLDVIDFLQGQIDAISTDIDALLLPHKQQLSRLMQIPGIGPLAAAAILAEMGTDMTCFPSAKHLASWAGVAPGNKQSGGKRLKAHTNKGNTHLRAVLAEVVWVISHTRDNYLSAQYHRLAHRLGKKRAIVAVSHSLVTIIYHMLQENEDYHELGFHYFQTLDTTRQRDTAVRRLQALGYKVSLEEITEVRA